ncbi:MAG: SIR2 family protein [Magnetococcales bacterium]|nr:SIR2 family protein [Magnetococcales bacterium]
MTILDISDGVLALKDKFKQSKLCPFIGARFSGLLSDSLAVSGFVSMLDRKIATISSNPLKLENYLLNCCTCSDPATTCLALKIDFPNAIELAYAQFRNGSSVTREDGKKLFAKWLAAETDDIINNASNHSFSAHDIIIHNFRKIYTTNWDRALELRSARLNKSAKIFTLEIKERARVKSGIKYNIGYAQREINFPDANGISVDLYKLHGCASNHKTIVGSVHDYSARLGSMSGMKFKIDEDLVSDATTNTIMFLGYSLADQNIKFALHHASSVKSVISRTVPYTPEKHFLVVDDSRIDSPYAEHLSELYNIVVVNLSIPPSADIIKRREVYTKFLQEITG